METAPARKVSSPLPKIAIVGRPNVGKSTFFNRLLGRRKSIVLEESGTTRDRVKATVDWQGRYFTLIDTGGMRLETKEFFDPFVDREVEKALKEANLVIFMADGKVGLTPMDEQMADKIRRLRKPTAVAVNKLDIESPENELAPFYKLGLGDPMPISALHGYGIGDLMDSVVPKIPIVQESLDRPAFSLTIVGEPNVGKSTLLNSYLCEERAIVSEVAGTTRDSIEEILTYRNHFIRLIDTAGIRHKSKIKHASDLFSLARAKGSIKDSDVTFLIFDAEEGIRRDTKAIARILEEERKPVVLVANKWDLVKNKEQAVYDQELKRFLGFLKYSIVAFISAKDKKNLEKLLDQGIDLWKRANRHIATSELNDFLERMKRKRLPTPSIRLKFLTQTSAVPQEFVCFVKNKKYIPANYHAHFENELIRHFKLEGIPIRLHFREPGVEEEDD